MTTIRLLALAICSLAALDGLGIALYVARRAEPKVAPGRSKAGMYQVAEIPTLGGPTTYHGGGGLNNQGQVVGASQAQAGAGYHAFLWTNGKLTDLGTLGGSGSMAYSVNDRGHVVGGAETAEGTTRAFLWEQGRMHDLGTLPGFSHSVAMAINYQGQVVGRAYTPTKEPYWAWPSRAFLWERGNMHDLGTPAGCTFSRAYDINDRGQVVGWALNRRQQTTACLWEHGRIMDLGARSGYALSVAMAINNGGQIVGNAGNSAETIGAVLWQVGQVQRLGVLASETYSKATAISNTGEVVGDARAGNEFVPCFRWSRRRKMQNLSTLLPEHSGWYLQHAFAMNDRGQVLAWGDYKDRTERLCLLTPAPSPSQRDSSKVVHGSQ